MSCNGVVQFSENVKTLMATDAWKQADDSDKMQLGWCLLNSKYGVGSSHIWMRLVIAVGVAGLVLGIGLLLR